MLTTDKKSMIADLNSVLDTIRPHLAADGGDVEVVDVTDDLIVKVKWIGSCINCSMSAMTMKAGIEQTLKSKFPSVTKVVAIN